MKVNKRTCLLFLSLAFALCVDARVIRVLAIGNSFSADAIEQYLYELAVEGGDSLVIGNAYRGGQGLESHWKVVEAGKAEFEYHKVVGGRRENLPRRTLLECLDDEPWDYITFQQVSQDSGDYASYEPWLTRLLDYVKAHVRNRRVKYAFHRTWAYAQDSRHGGFKKYGNSQLRMYRSIVEASRRACRAHRELRMLIPSGTAIQNGRATALGDSFTRDGYHLNDLGRYTAACVWLEKLTRQNPVGKRFRPASLNEAAARTAQQAAHAAVRRPNRVTDL